MDWRGCVVGLAYLMTAGCGPAVSDSQAGGGDGDEATGMDSESPGATTTDDPPVAGCEAALSKDACDAVPVGETGQPQCVWAEVHDVIDPATCGLSEPIPTCVQTVYQGEGCLVGPTCGENGHSRIYVRDGLQGQQVFAGDFCETYPEGWSECVWLDQGGGTIDPPEDPVCDCLCPNAGEDPPPGAPCEDATTADECAAMGSGRGGYPACGWVQTQTVADAASCSLEPGSELCVPLTYQGDGCGDSQPCGGAGASNIYVRDDGDAQQIFEGDFCETQPSGWTACVWSTDGAGEVVPPDEQACSCLCV